MRANPRYDIQKLPKGTESGGTPRVKLRQCPNCLSAQPLHVELCPKCKTSMEPSRPVFS